MKWQKKMKMKEWKFIVFSLIFITGSVIRLRCCAKRWGGIDQVRVMNGSEMLSIWTTPINEKKRGKGQHYGLWNTHTRLYTSIHIQTHAFTHIQIHAFTQTHIHTHVRICLRTHIHIHVRAHTHTHRHDCNGKYFFLGGGAMKLFWKAKVMKNTLIRLIFGEGDGNFRAAFFVVLQKKFSFCLYFFFVTVWQGCISCYKICFVSLRKHRKRLI